MTALAARYGLTHVTRPPAWVASGNPTPQPGTPALLASNDADATADYHSFPSTAFDGTTLHLTYRKGGDHNITPNGDIIYRTRPVNGAWTAETVAVPRHESLIVGDPNLHILPNGNVLMLFTMVNIEGTGLRENYATVRSGGAWSEPVKITTDFPDGQVTIGGLMGTWDDRVFHALYARPTGSGTRGTYLYEWDPATKLSTLRSTITTPGFLSKDWEEPTIIRRSDGLALAYLRDDVTKATYLSWSPDLDRWSFPWFAFDGWGKPNIGVNPDGDMLVITRHPADGRACWSFCSDGGRTWTPVDYLDEQTGMMEYGSVCWLPGEGWVGVYAVEQGVEYTGPCHLFEVAFT